MNRAQLLRLTRGGEPPKKPVVVEAPLFLGAATVGQTLTATNGVWANDVTGYDYQHQSSVDGQDWVDIAGATAQALLVGSELEGLYLRAGVRAENAVGAADDFAHSSPVGPVAAALTKLVPSAAWTGAAGSGFADGVPEDPVRVNGGAGKPWLRDLMPWDDTFGEDFTIGVVAGTDDTTNQGIEKVIAYCEGNAVEITAPSYHTYQDANGVSRTVFGYFATFDHAAIMALNPSGDMEIYWRAVPVNGSFQERVIGPRRYYARLPGVASGTINTHVYDIELSIAPSQPQIAQQRYQTIVAALNYINTAPVKRRPLLTIVENGAYALGGVTVDYLQSSTWATIQAAPGVTAIIGDGASTGYMPKYDGLRFRGAGIVIDTAACNYQLSSAIRCQTGSNFKLWFDGCEIKTGSPNPAFGGSGSGTSALFKGRTQTGYWLTTQNNSEGNWFFTEVDAHDLAGYGLGFCKLVRNCSVERVGGSGHENVYLIHGGRVSTVSGILSGLRTNQDAFTLSYSGPASLVEYEKPDPSGAQSAFKVYEDGVETHSVDIGTDTLNPTSVQAVVDAINTWSGFTATIASPAPTRAAKYLNVPGNPPSAGIPRTPLSGTANFITIVDVHSDAIVYNGKGRVHENACAEFISVENTVGSAFLSLDGGGGNYTTWRDFGARLITSQDTTADYPPNSSQPGYQSGIWDHVVWQYISMAGSGEFFSGGFQAVSGAYNKIDHCALGSLSWTAAADPDVQMTHLSVTSGSLPPPANSDPQSKAQGGVADTTLYTDLANLNFTPLAPLQAPDGSWYGALLPTGERQGVGAAS